MLNYIDIVIVIILIYNLMRGYISGFIKVVVDISAYIVSFWIAKVYTVPILEYSITHFQLVKDINEAFIMKFDSIFVEGANALLQKIPKASELNENLSFLNDVDLQNIVMDKTDNLNMLHNTSVHISSSFMRGLMSIAIFILVFLAIKTLGLILEMASELPILKSINKSIGVVFGFIKGILIVCILMSIVSFIAPNITDSAFMKEVTTSHIGNFIYNHNILLILIKKILS